MKALLKRRQEEKLIEEKEKLKKRNCNIAVESIKKDLG